MSTDVYYTLLLLYLMPTRYYHTIIVLSSKLTVDRLQAVGFAESESRSINNVYKICKSRTKDLNYILRNNKI